MASSPASFDARYTSVTTVGYPVLSRLRDYGYRCAFCGRARENRAGNCEGCGAPVF